MDKFTNKLYNEGIKRKELKPMAVAEKRAVVQKVDKRIPLSQAIKKIGVRSAFGVSAVDLYKNERQGK